jgi:hypothetical protein
MTFDPSNTILAGVSVPTLQQWLSDAQSAMAALMTGRREVSVSYDGKSVTYSDASRGDLAMWILQLQRQLGMGRGRRALRPYFR